jgi:hypothetical protein
MHLTLQYRGSDNKWHTDLSPHDFLGQQVEHILLIANDRDVVARIEDKDSRHYLCGTDALVRHYRSRQCQAQTFQDYYNEHPEIHGKCPHLAQGALVWL